MSEFILVIFDHIGIIPIAKVLTTVGAEQEEHLSRCPGNMTYRLKASSSN
uniref:Uncharacterized protein n=1 Tax=Anguilla anguilla TaxID=7936 RepID=A0A0E9SL11_ANGAN